VSAAVCSGANAVCAGDRRFDLAVIATKTACCAVLTAWWSVVCRLTLTHFGEVISFPAATAGRSVSGTGSSTTWMRKMSSAVPTDRLLMTTAVVALLVVGVQDRRCGEWRRQVGRQ